MHVILKDPTTGQQEGLVCIERSTHTCFVLSADIERLNDLVKIAQAQKVPEVFLVVPEAAVQELEDLGWKRADKALLVMRPNGT